MSGTGKSTILRELATRGYRVVDTDCGDWHEWAIVAGEWDRILREDRIRELLAAEDTDVLFVSGTVSNQRRFYPQFDHIVLLSAPVSVIVERLAARTNNPYGKRPQELARILGHVRSVEPQLRHMATLEVDASAQIAHVVETILQHVGLIVDRPERAPLKRFCDS